MTGTRLPDKAGLGTARTTAPHESSFLRRQESTMVWQGSVDSLLAISGFLPVQERRAALSDETREYAMACPASRAFSFSKEHPLPAGEGVPSKGNRCRCAWGSPSPPAPLPRGEGRMKRPWTRVAVRLPIGLLFDTMGELGAPFWDANDRAVPGPAPQSRLTRRVRR